MNQHGNGSHLIVPGDFFATLRNCKGLYEGPRDAVGMPLGPVVGYTASYDGPEGKKLKWVGLDYLNFATADPHPAVLTFFAEEMARKLQERRLVPNVILGAPWAAVKFSQEVARILGCRHVFAEKEPFISGMTGELDTRLILGRYEGAIQPGDVVGIGEELVNNASTTGTLINLVEGAGGYVSHVFCAINRSSPFKNTFWERLDADPIPIIGVIEKSYPQYHQDDPIVAGAIAAGNVVWKPKYAWEQFQKVMEQYAKK